MINSIAGLIHCLQHQLVRMLRIIRSALPIQRRRQRQQRRLQLHQLHSSSNKEGTYRSHRLHSGSFFFFSFELYFSVKPNHLQWTNEPAQNPISFMYRSIVFIRHTKPLQQCGQRIKLMSFGFFLDWLDQNLTI